MKDYMNNMLKVLNSISRVAVIENAPVTEKMLNIYSNILKYRWNEEGKEVTVAKEMEIALKCCELFTIKNNGRLVYGYKVDSELNTLFMPHYTIIVCLKKVLDVLDSLAKQCELQINVEQIEGMIWIQFLFSGQIDFTVLLQRITNGMDQEIYEDFNEAVKRWRTYFGENTFEMAATSQNSRQLKLRFGCN